MPSKTTAKTAPDPDAAPRFDFDALAPVRDTVRSGGRLHEIRTLDDFGIVKQRELDRDGREFSRLWTSDKELDENEQLRLKLLLNRIFEDLVDAPKTVKAKFSDAQKAKLVLDFSLAPLREVLAAQMQAAMQSQAETPAEESTTTT